MMNRRFVRILGLLVLLTQNLNIIETTDINGEGRQKDVNVTHLETVKDEKPNSSNVSAFPVANNDTFFSHHPSRNELDPALPGKGSAEEEHHNSLSIFLVLVLLGICILLIHVMLKFHFHYVPESVAVIFVGALIGLFLKLMSYQHVADWAKEAAFSPTIFFLVLLPPIIFESGYNLHKGNFFQNIGSITVFAVFGTLISAVIVGSGVYVLGLADIAYKLSFIESFAFGSLISAVDPVATLAIFQALDVDPVLNMLVFGESILNDAVAIVLTTTILEIDSPEMNDMSGEFSMMMVFTYLPYALAEGIHLSGIMAILFCGIVMSHYTHYNLSPITQITMKQTMRTIAFIAETSVFAYLGLGIFSFPHRFEPALVIWSIVLCLLGRLVNIFPLSALVNRFRQHKITKKMMFIMWFSGLRGAIAYALSLHLEFEMETRRVIVTTTLVIVLFTILVLGGSTMPLLKCLKSKSPIRNRLRKSGAPVNATLSKTLKLDQPLESDVLSEMTEEEMDVTLIQQQQALSGFIRFDLQYLFPIFTHRFSRNEVRECRQQMSNLASQWQQAVRSSPAAVSSSTQPVATSQLNNSEANNISE
ncbi:Sodium/hydrogen exchanger [Daphnia magna]|uniref:Sodium/hydrogen exchanger 8 n=1 Tax=Daphnia magna TaxID=35525 RepID=A0A162C7I3_9CRUS|nr:Sodium/hydrogen exchanger [Daphnia magna]